MLLKFVLTCHILMLQAIQLYLYFIFYRNNKKNATQCSWISRVMGSINVSSPSFARYPQILLQIIANSKVTVTAFQDTHWNNRKNLAIFIFKTLNDGNPVSRFAENEIVARSQCTMRTFTSLTATLSPQKHPYIIVCAHTTHREGTFKLDIECSSEAAIAFPRFCLDWNIYVPRHFYSIKGEWKGTGSAGSLEQKSWHLSPQYPILVQKPSKVVFRLKRNVQYNLSMGMMLLKSNSTDGKFRKSAFNDEDVVALYTQYTSNETIEFNTYVTPRMYPYTLIPLVEQAGMEGMFSVEIESEHPLEVQSDKSNAIELVEKVCNCTHNNCRV